MYSLCTDVRQSQDHQIPTHANGSGYKPCTQTRRYIPKVVLGVENLVLMEVQKLKGVGRWSAKGPPVPKARQDPTCFYCDNCDSHYNRADELVRHK